MNEMIATETFPELERWHHGDAAGEFSSQQEARVTFARVMQSHGYQLDANRVWLKVGCAAVMEP